MNNELKNDLKDNKQRQKLYDFAIGFYEWMNNGKPKGTFNKKVLFINYCDTLFEKTT